jgi:heme/copper-type cytochrome/quinol oxidase subunit 2
MTNNSGAFQLTPLADGVTEGAETFTVTLHTGSGVGPVVTSVGPITINDTSQGTFTPDYTINVTTPIFDYVFNGTHGGGTLTSAAQPALTFSVGDKVQFNIDSSTQTSHPFYLKTVQGSGTGNQISGVVGQGGATLQWIVGGTGVYYYQCGVHGSMNNTITVT